MPRRKKANKSLRYLTLYRRQLKKLTWKKFCLWVNKNLKGHPFILGFFALLWLTFIIDLFFVKNKPWDLLKLHLRFHGVMIASWFGLVILSNLLIDKTKVKWYFAKRFVFVLMVLVAPLGIILMWAGSRFKRITKLILTAVFTIYFVGLTVSHQIKYQKIINMSSFERVSEMVTKKKKTTFLKGMAASVLRDIKLEVIPHRQKTKLAVSDIYARYSRGIVSITTKDKYGKEIGSGSGFILSKDGIIVTNAHVIASAYSAEIKIGDNVFQDVSLIKNLPNFDIAVLKIDAQGLIPLSIGDSEPLTTGEFIVVLGNPFGFESSVSSGIISAIRSGNNMKLIQMTAPVSSGSSGGPVLNEYGEVIGITTVASFFAQNLNFAVPINYLKKIIAEDK